MRLLLKKRNTFLESNNILKIVSKKKISIFLSCIVAIPSKKRNTFDIAREKDNYILDKDLTQNQAEKRIEKYTRAAESRKVTLDKHIDNVIKERKLKLLVTDIATYIKQRKILKRLYEENPELLLDHFYDAFKIIHFPLEENKKFYEEIISKYPKLKSYIDTETKKFRQRNIAEFNTKKIIDGNLVDEVKELVHSGDEKLYDDFLNIFDSDPLPLEIKQFKKGVTDNVGRTRKGDSEFKYIFGFLKNHFHTADEFIIETKNIFFTCPSCQRELIMLKRFVESKGKKLTLKIHGDTSIDGAINFKNNILN